MDDKHILLYKYEVEFIQLNGLGYGYNGVDKFVTYTKCVKQGDLTLQVSQSHSQHYLLRYGVLEKSCLM